MEYKIKSLTDPTEKAATCKKIIRMLPGWFGMEDSNRKYIQDALELPALAIKHDNENIALLVYKQINDHILGQTVINIHWLGILPGFHRKGLGRKIVNMLANIARSDKAACLTVETLDPAAEDEDYLIPTLINSDL